MNLNELGWTEYFSEQFDTYKEQDLIPGRVVASQRNQYMVCCQGETLQGELAGKFRYKATQKKHFPVVGDWVGFQPIPNSDRGMIHGVLERKTAFVRKMVISGGRKIKDGKIVGGTPEEQVIASNIDTVFIVSGLDGNFNLQRIERYITLVYNSGATPVVLLNKMDLCNHLSDYIEQVEKSAIGIAVYPISVTENQNMDVLDSYLFLGQTVVFLGSSGVGKSTITNYLLGQERQKTKTISTATGKGRHTTTTSELLFHPSGAMIIDTPGLRELQLWGGEGSLEDSFEDIIVLAKQCRFGDCQHDTEPGCAVKQAIDKGVITYERYESYMKQLEELHQASKIARKAQRYRSMMTKRKMHNMKLHD